MAELTLTVVCTTSPGEITLQADGSVSLRALVTENVSQRLRSDPLFVVRADGVYYNDGKVIDLPESWGTGTIKAQAEAVVDALTLAGQLG